MRLRHAAAHALLAALVTAQAYAQTPAPRRSDAGGTHAVAMRLLSGRWSARRVELAGTFNDWKPQPMGLARGGDWLSYVPLKPGKYLYKFVVDGRWVIDPYNFEAEVDDEGRVNSVLRVEATDGGRDFRTNQHHDETRRRFRVVDALADAGGGRRLHFRCAGSAAPGRPTVFLEAGHASSAEPWFKIVPEVARFARVCAYDRAGRGESDPPARAEGRTYEDVFRDFEAVLAAAKVDGPVVLVGHSLGGVFVRLYAARRPGRVAGLVLVDAPHEEQEERKLAAVPAEVKAQFSEEERRMMSPEGFDFDRIFEEARRTRRRLTVPLVVLTAMRVDLSADPRIAPYTQRFEEIRQELQRELATYSTRGRQVLARESGHYVQWDQPDLVVESIRGVLAESPVANPRRGTKR